MKMLLYHTSKRKIKKTRSFYELCSVVLSFLLNLVLCLLAEDFIGMFIHFSDSKVYILAIIVSVLLTVYGFLHANHIYIKHYAIPLEDRKNPVKVAFLSDIHTGTFVNKIDLVVFGHTHKGQFFPANSFTKWSYGRQGFYGHSKTNKTYSIVSSGAGYFQMPIRIGTNSEIVQIDIT